MGEATQDDAKMKRDLTKLCGGMSFRHLDRWITKMRWRYTVTRDVKRTSSGEASEVHARVNENGHWIRASTPEEALARATYHHINVILKEMQEMQDGKTWDESDYE